MLKIMFFLYRRPDLSSEDFVRYSEKTHIPLVAAVPGLTRYVVNHVVANPSAAPAACDAVAELSFASMADFQAALGTPAGQAALADQANYLDLARTHMLIVEENRAIG